MAEDKSPNRSRGNDYMEGHERQAAYSGNAQFSDELLKTAGKGAAWSAASAAAGMAAPAVLSAVGTAATFVAAAAIPAVASYAAVTGMFKVWDWLTEEDDAETPEPYPYWEKHQEKPTPQCVDPWADIYQDIDASIRSDQEQMMGPL
jgi:hypothetical protein